MAARNSTDSVPDTAPLLFADTKPQTPTPLTFHRPPPADESIDILVQPGRKLKMVTMIFMVRIAALGFGLGAGAKMIIHNHGRTSSILITVLTWLCITWNIVQIIASRLPHHTKISVVYGNGKTIHLGGGDDEDGGNEHRHVYFRILRVAVVDLVFGGLLVFFNLYYNIAFRFQRSWWDGSARDTISVLGWFNTVFQLIIAGLALSPQLRKAHIRFERVETRPSYAIRLPRDSVAV